MGGLNRLLLPATMNYIAINNRALQLNIESWDGENTYKGSGNAFNFVCAFYHLNYEFT